MEEKKSESTASVVAYIMIIQKNRMGFGSTPRLTRLQIRLLTSNPNASVRIQHKLRPFLLP